jgi:hypothetical protein
MGGPRCGGLFFVLLRLEAGWVFASYVEVTFEGKADAGDGAFVEEAADESDAVGDAARWVELWEWFAGVGRPVAAGFGDFNEAGSKSEGGVAGEVGDGEDFVAQGWDEEKVDLIHDARHFEGDHAAEAVGLHEVDGGEEAGLTEGVGPRVGDLGFEHVELMVEGDLFEGCGGFGEEDEVKIVVGPVGESDFDWGHSYGLDGGQGGAIDVGGRGFFHPLREVADSEIFYRGLGVEAEFAGD